MESYNKINKPTARKMYNLGCSIMLLPCKVRLDNEWVKPTTISLFDSEYDINEFNRAVNDYEYYNCNAELGYYAHYYVSDEELAKYEMCNLMCK